MKRRDRDTCRESKRQERYRYTDGDRSRHGREREIGDGSKRRPGTEMETKVKPGLEECRGGDEDEAETGDGRQDKRQRGERRKGGGIETEKAKR